MIAWLLYLLAPPRPRVLSWPLDKLSTRARPVDLSDGLASTTTASACPPSAGAPRRQTCTVLTADGAELWEYE